MIFTKEIIVNHITVLLIRNVAERLLNSNWDEDFYEIHEFISKNSIKVANSHSTFAALQGISVSSQSLTRS